MGKEGLDLYLNSAKCSKDERLGWLSKALGLIPAPPRNSCALDTAELQPSCSGFAKSVFKGSVCILFSFVVFIIHGGGEELSCSCFCRTS